MKIFNILGKKKLIIVIAIFILIIAIDIVYFWYFIEPSYSVINVIKITLLIELVAWAIINKLFKFEFTLSCFGVLLGIVFYAKFVYEYRFKTMTCREYYKEIGIITGKSTRTRPTYYYIKNTIGDTFGLAKAGLFIGKPYSEVGDSVLLVRDSIRARVIDWYPSLDTIIKFQKPVKYNGVEELGNDYFGYTMKNLEIVYKNFGLNLVFKATFGGSVLHLTDICGKTQSIKYSPKNYETLPDTFLVFRNINENIDDRFTVCAPEVNTPENWAKISDYGYIFHYDVYSKEEIESQCPQIRNYVEKYKERNTE